MSLTLGLQLRLMLGLQLLLLLALTEYCGTRHACGALVKCLDGWSRS